MMNYNLRLNKLQSSLITADVDAALISNYYNILYLIGFAGLSAGERESWLLVTRDKIYHITDGRYQQMLFEHYKDILRFWTSQNDVKILITNPHNRLTQIITNVCNKNNIQSLGFEPEDLKYNEYQLLI